MDFFLLHDLHQERRLNEQAIDIAHAKGATARVRRETERLSATVERLRLAMAAMWELTRERHGLSDRELLDRIREIDLRDGVLDGRMKATPRECPGCQRVNKASRQACLYCGAPLTPTTPV